MLEVHNNRQFVGMQQSHLDKLKMASLENKNNGLYEAFLRISKSEQTSQFGSRGLRQIIDFFDLCSLDTVLDSECLCAVSWNSVEKYFESLQPVTFKSLYMSHQICNAHGYDYRDRLPSPRNNIWAIADTLSFFAAFLDDMMDVYVGKNRYIDFKEYVLRTGHRLIDLYCADGNSCDASIDLGQTLAQLSKEGSVIKNEHFLYFIDILIRLIRWVNREKKLNKKVSIAWLKRFLVAVCEEISGSEVQYDLYDSKSSEDITINDYVMYRSLTSDMEVYFCFIGLINNLDIDEQVFRNICLSNSHKKIGILAGNFNDIFARNKEIAQLQKLRDKGVSSGRAFELLEKQVFINNKLLDKNTFAMLWQEAYEYLQHIENSESMEGPEYQCH